jgi:DNA-binding NtrC family response regulator
MSLAVVEQIDDHRPTILFVDDEERVLKSMRAMFRRDYEVLLANSGAQALALLEEHNIDVVVSDQRMPEMTGVEVLTEIKLRSPATMRILLTGYADLAAVEASLNEAEVFKYLMKPCPADEVRGAVAQALEFRQNGSHQQATAEVVETVDQPKSNVAYLPKRAKERKAVAHNVAILVLSHDKQLSKGVEQACPQHKVLHSANLDASLELIRKHPVGVLVTDMGVDQKAVATLSQAVRQVTPDMVIILASERSDANVLIQLINSGQVFRFLLKPLQIGQCKIWLTSALRRFADSGGEALAVLDAAPPSVWIRFKNWFLGVQG